MGGCHVIAGLVWSGISFCLFAFAQAQGIKPMSVRHLTGLLYQINFHIVVMCSQLQDSVQLKPKSIMEIDWI